MEFTKEQQKERLSQDSHSSRHKNKGNPCPLDITDEKVHDGRILKKLVNHVLDNRDKKKIKSVLADGACRMTQMPTLCISKRKRSLLRNQGKKEFRRFIQKQRVKE